MIMGLDYGREWNLGFFFFLITFKVYLVLLEIITLNLIIILII